MGRLANARSDHITRWVIPTASRLLIRAASKGADTRPLAEVAHIEMGQSPRGESYNKSGEGVPFIGGPADLGLTFPNTKRWTSAPTKLSEPGDIIVCVRATIGEPRWADGVYCLGRGVAGIRPTSKELDSQFLFRIVQASEQKLREQGSGTTFKTISKKHIAAIPVPAIPLETQEAISAFLGWLEHSNDERPNFAEAPPLPEFLYEQRRIVVRIEELAAKVEAAQALRQQAAAKAEVLVPSTLSYIFDYQPDDILPEGWVWRYFRDLLFDRKAGMKTGPFGTLLQKVDVQSEGVPILGIANVHANRFVPGFTDFVSHQKAKQLSPYRLQEGDIVVARSGTVGRSCVVPRGLEPAPIMSTNLIRLRLNRHVFLPELLCHLFNRSRLIERHKESECRGSTRSFFTQKILSRLQVPVPPISEQRRIIAYLDHLQATVDVVKQHQAATAAALDALLPSILDRAFRGEL